MIKKGWYLKNGAGIIGNSFAGKNYIFIFISHNVWKLISNAILIKIFKQ